MVTQGKLSVKQLEVLKLSAEGLSIKQVPLHLEISSYTVKFHRANIVAVLGATNMVNAVAIAFRRGILN